MQALRGARNCAQGNGSTCNWLTTGQLQVSRLPPRAVPRAPERLQLTVSEDTCRGAMGKVVTGG
ncbi:hypothetical protein GCM10020229_59200 [Kitasatospora albolonga]